MKDSEFVKGYSPTDYFDFKVPILALDYYQPDSHGEDDFSRKQAWFTVYGDEEIEAEFETRLRDLVNSQLKMDGVGWDLATLCPSHVEGEVNRNMAELLQKVLEDSGIDYRQVLRRIETVKESHDLDSVRSKIVNAEGSLEADDVEGKNVVLVDNIAISGVTFGLAANKLREAGAENVIGVTLGITEDLEADESDQNLRPSELLKG